MPSGIGRLMICPECGEGRRHGGHGLCKRCYQRWWRQQNPDKYKAQKARHYQKHREAEQEKALRRHHLNREHNIRRMRKDYYENRDYHKERSRRWRMENPEKAKETKRNYYRAHPERVMAEHARYKARKNSVPNTLATAQAERILERGECFYCGSMDDLTLDHFVPIYEGGGTTMANMVLACRSCNSAKWRKPPEEFITQLCLEGIWYEPREISSTSKG